MGGAILQGEATRLWRDLVLEGEARCATRLEEDVEAYLVFVLMRHLGDAGLLRRTMALDLLEALEASGRARLDELRDVGDRCLLIACSRAWRRAVGSARTISPTSGAAPTPMSPTPPGLPMRSCLRGWRPLACHADQQARGCRSRKRTRRFQPPPASMRPSCHLHA